MIVAKLRAIPGVKLAEPQGAFYVLPEMSAFFGPGAEAKDFGPVPDSDTFCMYLMQKAHVSETVPNALMRCLCMPAWARCRYRALKFERGTLSVR